MLVFFSFSSVNLMLNCYINGNKMVSISWKWINGIQSPHTSNIIVFCITTIIEKLSSPDRKPALVRPQWSWFHRCASQHKHSSGVFEAIVFGLITTILTQHLPHWRLVIERGVVWETQCQVAPVRQSDWSYWSHTPS